jgi:putative nucleotidyltransferase with HDIG domain
VSPRRKRKVKEPAFLKGLSEPPAELWPHGALHHGARILLLVGLAVAVLLLFPPVPRPLVTSYEEGDLAKEDITADIPFQVPRSPEELRAEQEAFEAAIPPTFQFLPEVRDSAEAQGRRFFDRIEEVADSGSQAQVEQVARSLIVAIEPGQVELLMDASNRRLLRAAFFDVTRDLLPIYLEANDAQQVAAQTIELQYPSGERERIPAETLLVGEEFFNEALERIRPAGPELEDLFQFIGFRLFRSPISFDLVATGVSRSRARLLVDSVKAEVLEGQNIIRVGDLVTGAKLRELTAYEDALVRAGRLQREGTDWILVLGLGLLSFIVFGVFGLLLFSYRPEVYRSLRWVLLLTLLTLAYFAAAAVISWQGLPWEFLPIAFAVLPVAILWDGRMALILALLLSVLTGALTPFDTYSIQVVTLLGGAAAALSARAVRRRSQTWIFIALITMAYSLAILATGFMEGTDPGLVLRSIGLAAGNATFSAILAMGFIPVFEWFTGITTDQTLLEWADPNRSLLKTLSLEASGTYAHTINVANLGEAAATAIGANGLLCRVGIYYHDVGKILKPQYFVENQPGGRNPHDKLKPHTSAGIIREHVIEGEKMARGEGVPEIVARFIPEHHGTQLIGFFYQKAKEESEEEPDPEQFRYPGPKPRSKETAISMLADSVESATRALKDPSPDRVRELVRAVVDGKIRDGQLSDAPLTLREIDIIQEQFVKVVSGMFHQRLDYPETKHLTEFRVTGGGDPFSEPSADSPLGRVGDPPSGGGSGDSSSDGSPGHEQLPLGASREPPASPEGDGS